MTNLFRLAQEVTDKVLGKGTYRKLNKFDPSSGETFQRPARLRKPKANRKRSK